MENRTGREILDGIARNAVEWSIENGLKTPVDAAGVIVTDFGFRVTTVERLGRRMATCTYLCDGTRSMYELDKKGA
jgi:hypothetical protein